MLVLWYPWNCIRDGFKALPLLSNSDNPIKLKVFGLQNKKFHHKSKKKVFRCGQNEPEIVVAERGELIRSSPRAQQWERSPAVCALKSLLCLFEVSTTSCLVLQTLPSLTALVPLTQLEAEVALWGHLGDLLKPDPAALMWPQAKHWLPPLGPQGLHPCPTLITNVLLARAPASNTFPQEKQLQLFSSHIFPLGPDQPKPISGWLFPLQLQLSEKCSNRFGWVRAQSSLHLSWIHTRSWQQEFLNAFKFSCSCTSD